MPSAIMHSENGGSTLISSANFVFQSAPVVGHGETQILSSRTATDIGDAPPCTRQTL